MIKKHEQVFAISDLSNISKMILESVQNIQIIALKGTLGAGKTTLAIEMLRQLGVKSEMQSPTYTYIQAYKNNKDELFYHFDLYRLKDKQDFLFAGFDEFLYQPNSLVIIEWPEIVESLLDHSVCFVELNYIDDVRRKINWYVE